VICSNSSYSIRERRGFGFLILTAIKGLSSAR
jgi:hypothetical protein